ncbi:MAG: FecR family protein [Mariniphaga sp.]
MKETEHSRHNISRKAEQLLKSYKVDTRSEKDEVFHMLLEKIEEKEQKPSRKISWYITAAASVAAAAAILIGFWLFTATHTIQPENGTAYALRLPDNSRVVLHDGSSLSYRKHFWNRNVSLSGEAYFEVEKGEGFRVKTNQGEVEVLGTRFLVQGNEKQFVVHCYEGKVKTSYNEDSWILEPGTRFTGDDESAGKETVEKENGYPGFATFTESFKNAPVNEVLQEVERFFEVDIELKGNSGKHFTGSIHTGSLENVLQIVCEPLNLKYAFRDKYRIIVY